MKLSRTMIVILLFVFPFLGVSFAQSHQAVNGKITFKGNGVPMSNIRVWLHEQSAGEMTSIPVDSLAKFHFNGDGYYDLVVTAPGFAPYARKIWLHDGLHLEIEVRLEYDYGNAQTD